ncbi:hypothetical protein COY17_01940 [Candidatus Saccharibacteria bacterium CG_4_10_14_0_2_um_filter_52_9]|nr:MAG: hypothetical protein COY17_01940 [Candidatus Saccharibacteria bacterium CG_4_10_14_0_2_um_filter_52_9]
MTLKKLNSHGLAHYVAPLLVMVGVGLIGVYLIVAGHAATSNRLVDVSYPQCKPKDLKTFGGDLGIVGVNHGKVMTKNPCFKKQALRFSRVAVYVNSGYNGERASGPCKQKTGDCYAFNYGYKAGQYDIKYAVSRGGQALVSFGSWWIDVEPANTWSSDKGRNVQFLKGMMSALTDAGVGTVGFYSTPYFWGVATGGWINNHPAWVPTMAPRSTADDTALSKYCKQEFTGARVWMVQYTDDLDSNVACFDGVRDKLVK